MTPFQVAKPLDLATESALRASIVRWGVLVPVVVDQNGNIIDGHHRSRIADDLGIDYVIQERHVADEAEAIALAVTLNADRRQLNPEERREMVAVLRDEGHTTRAIASALGVGQSTVIRDCETTDSRGSAPSQNHYDDDRNAMFDLASQVDDRGIGTVAIAEIAAKFHCDVKTVRRQLLRHPDVAQLPAKRYSLRHSAVTCIGQGAVAPRKGRGEWHVKRHRIDTDRVITATITTLSGLVMGLDLLDDDDIRAVDAEKRLAWIEALREPLRAINHLRGALNGNH